VHHGDLSRSQELLRPSCALVGQLPPGSFSPPARGPVPHFLQTVSRRMGVSNGVRKLKEAARIILVGAPGVGKGTQSERLMRRYPQLASISTGDLLRDNVRDKTPLGRIIESQHPEH
jgi:Adenylate kinase